MFPFMIPLLGAIGGAALNKKDPLKGALMGGGLAAGGGALLGAGGLGAAAGGSAASSGAALGSLTDAAPELAKMGYAGPENFSGGGLLDKLSGGLEMADKYAKPIGNAASAANSTMGLFGGPQPQQPAMPVNQGGPGVGQAMTGLLQQDQATMEQRMAEARKKMGLLGGGYGGIA